jgi:hypothetical protein
MNVAYPRTSNPISTATRAAIWLQPFPSVSYRQPDTKEQGNKGRSQCDLPDVVWQPPPVDEIDREQDRADDR